ncbi:MYND-type zinc finger-containing chromatin reader ZMYND8 isoform X2 [Zophobas morio]|uniref:MYND-type zinc finger-containing chromatin reader ZMYND8 isoform X2 n=1 Tax=Zophobas morio TaxID=2755281 RepID=UPI003082CE25
MSEPEAEAAPAAAEEPPQAEDVEAPIESNGCEAFEADKPAEFEYPECDTSQDSTDKAETSSLDEGKGEPAQASESNDDSNTPKTSRELKSILALSKEAKLDTNISSQRRKALDKGKGTPKRPKMTAFPVTAESELENFDVKMDEKKPKKRKLSSGLEMAEGATVDETKRGVQGLSGDFIMPRKPNKDIFCWRCHHDSVQVACETCPRAYHVRCLKQTIMDAEHWPCPECVSILKAENTQTRSKAMRGMSLEHLCSLLKFAVKRMIQCNGSEPFIHPVDEKQFPEYRSYIVQPMTLTMLEKNIKDNAYGSTQAFEADAKWILHNSIIFNSYQSKLTTAAKTIVKICKQEMAEVENCPSCYLNANTKKHTWFVEVCPKPHLLVWAKLKGFPYWPAKVMSINSSGMADVRFFGAHDKAWVSVKDCYLYSVKDPNSGKQKRNDIIECVKELELYVDNLREIYGRVNFAPFKTLLEADSQLRQLQVFLPNYRNDGKEIVWKMKEARSDKGKSGDESEGESSEESSDEEEEDGEDEDDRGKRKGEEKSNGDKHKEGMTRIDYRDSPADKPRLVQKPIKAILIRKRYSSDSIPENSIKMARRDPTKPDAPRLSVDNHIKLNETPEKLCTQHEEEKSKISSPPKLRISDQLIKKLEDMNDEEPEEGKEEVDGEPEKKVEEVVADAEREKSEEKESVEEKSEEKGDTEVNEDDKKENDESKKDEGEVKSDIETKVTEKEDEEDKGKEKELVEPTVIEEEEKSDDAQAPVLELCETIMNVEAQSVKDGEKDKEKPKEKESKKRKHEDSRDDTSKKKETDDDSLFPPNKMVKLVPIENILQKKNLSESSPSKPDQLIVLKEIRVMKDGKEMRNKTKKPEAENSATKEPPVKIKSEVESDDDDDVQYMEAKRQYLSALNISEKQKVPSKPKAHEIRTRSKTEEKKSRKEETTPKPAEEASKDVTKSAEVKEIYIKSLSKMQTPKHKARKSFPTPNYGKKTIVARKIIPKTTMDDELTIVNAATLQPSANVMILPKLHYTKPMNRDLSSPPVLTMLPRVQDQNAAAVAAAKKVLEGSQNYIPQNEDEERAASGSGGILLNNLLTSGTTQPPVIDVDSQTSSFESELGSLKEILPENVAKGVGDILCQPPPKLKPKPVGILNSVVEAGVPSTAGPVASRINSMAQKLGDYFRSLLVETISDLGKSNNPEATISGLKYEIEELNHKHSIELAEIRRNVSIVLKDTQKSVVEERERIINETKANCEMEMMKKVEEAKSKQWCANCSKEAQFYCCWNTSYCDYPCQQKHWPKHMSKCTQTSGQNQSTSSPVRPAGQQLVLTPTAAPKFGTLFAKPQKVYLKRTTAPFKPTTGSHITLVESTPGNFELLGSGPIAVNGKILASTSVIEKIKCGNIVTVTAPSGQTNTQLTSVNQKVNTVAKSTASSADSEH